MNKAYFIVMIVVLCLGFLSCCNPDENGDKPNGDNHQVNSTADDNGNDNGTIKPVELIWANPWKKTNAGDSAVYKTDAGSENWEYVIETDVLMVVKTTPGDEMLGIPPTENRIPLSDVLKSTTLKWWETTREKGMNFDIDIKIGEITVKCTKIKIGNREYTVSEKVPFDGVIELKIDGKTVRKLVNFKRADGK